MTAAEFPQFATYRLLRDPEIVIPNGVRKEDFVDFDKTFLVSRGVKEAPTILFMGRLNPIKGPDLLLHAFLHVRDILPDHQLIFAGFDGGLLKQLKDLVVTNGLSGRVKFLGHIEGVEKLTFYKCARLLLVPSGQEAMSIVAMEAGICVTPALICDQCGFSQIRLVDPLLEVSANVAAIATKLAQLVKSPLGLAKTGLLSLILRVFGRNIIDTTYPFKSDRLFSLGFYQQVSLENGLRDYYLWYRHAVLQQDLV